MMGALGSVLWGRTSSSAARPPVPTVEAMGLIMMPLFISDVIQSLADLTSVATRVCLCCMTGGKHCTPCMLSATGCGGIDL